MNSLYQRGVGYSYERELVRILPDGTVLRVPVTEHVKPDTTAIIFWLKNRDPANWKDRGALEPSVGRNQVPPVFTFVLDTPNGSRAGDAIDESTPQLMRPTKSR